MQTGRERWETTHYGMWAYYNPGQVFQIRRYLQHRFEVAHRRFIKIGWYLNPKVTWVHHPRGFDYFDNPLEPTLHDGHPTLGWKTSLTKLEVVCPKE